MSTNDSDDLVVFLDADGNEISNDPRWHARKLQAQVAEQQKQEGEQELDDDGHGQSDALNYADLSVPDIKALAVERGLSLAGIKKKSEVVALLVADDERLAEEAAKEN